MDRLIKIRFFDLLAETGTADEEALEAAYCEFAAQLVATAVSTEEDFSTRYNILAFTAAEVGAIQKRHSLSGAEKK